MQGERLLSTQNQSDGARSVHVHLSARSFALRTLIAITLLMTFRTFQLFPYMEYVEEFWFVLCFFALAAMYPVWKIATGLRFLTFELFMIGLILVDVMLPAWTASREFGQPLVYGMLAQRGAVLIVVPILLVSAMRSRRVSVRDVESALVACAWGTCLLFVAMMLFLNPADFTSYGVGFARYANGRAVFTVSLLNGAFLLFGILYYTLKGLRGRRVKYYIAAMIFFVVVFSETNGRGAIISLTITILYFLYRWRSFKQFLMTIVKFAGVGALSLVLLYIVSPTFLSTRIAGFADAFVVAFTGSEVQDTSATGKLFETMAALPYIQDHPLLGNGVISRQWGGGTTAVLGITFYAGDIGILGMLFTVGLIGLLIFSFQFRFAVRATRMLPASTHRPLSDAATAFVLFCALDSLMTGIFVSDPWITLTFIAILVGLSYMETTSHQESAESVLLIHPINRSTSAQATG